MKLSYKKWLNVQVSVNGLDKAGSTPLHWAANGGHMDCLTNILSQPKVEINVQVSTGSPLHEYTSKFVYPIDMANREQPQPNPGTFGADIVASCNLSLYHVHRRHCHKPQVGDQCKSCCSWFYLLVASHNRSWILVRWRHIDSDAVVLD